MPEAGLGTPRTGTLAAGTPPQKHPPAPRHTYGRQGMLRTADPLSGGNSNSPRIDGQALQETAQIEPLPRNPASVKQCQSPTTAQVSGGRSVKLVSATINGSCP